MDREILARGQMFHQGEKRHQWDRQVGAYVPKTVSGLRTNFVCPFNSNSNSPNYPHQALYQSLQTF